MPKRLPLTYQQQWLWRLMQGRTRWQCMVPVAFCLDGALDWASLRASLAQVTERHEALRSRIAIVDGTPVQEIDEPGVYSLEVVTVSGASPAEITANAQKTFDEFADREIDLALEQPMSVKLIRLGDRRHWLMICLHRLAVDCFSAEQVFRELWCIYRELSQKRSSPFADAPAQYGEYAVWQQKTDGEWRSRHEPYWKQRLVGAEAIRWPVDQRAPRAAKGVAGRMSAWFEETLSAEIREFARRARTLSATVMLVAYIAVLWRRCRQRDFIVPFNIAGRQSEHRYVVGYFSHILYLRLQLKGDETVRDLLDLVGNEFFRALAHQDFGRMAMQQPQFLVGAFCQWVTWHPEEDPEPVGTTEPRPLTIKRLSIRDFGEGLSALPPGMVDVDLTFFDTPQGIYASGVYRADRFSSDTMAEFMSEVQSAARLLVHNPQARLMA
jgi:Condensation domain